MSTQPNPAAAGGTPFKTQEELEAFLKRVVVEEAGDQFSKALAPLQEKQTNLLREMLAEAQRSNEAATARPKGHMFARMVRAKALAFKEYGVKDDLDAVKTAVSKFWGSDDPVMKGIEGTKAVKATASQASDATSLGNLIIPQWSREFVELLRNRTVIRSIARVIPNPTGSLTLRRQTAGGVAYWVGEGLAITPSKPGVGLMNFLRKKLAALSVISNDMLRFAGPEADQFILDDLLIVTALAEDVAFIRSEGTEYSPKGIRHLVAAANVFAQSGTALADIDADLSKAMRLLEEANVYVEPGDLHWLLIPRTWWALWNAKATTDTGFRPYREGLNKKQILGEAAHKTNQIPKNLGAGTETETYCVHGPSLWIADTLNVQVDIFPGGAYQDGAAVGSGISNDETPVRVLKETDFNMRHQEAATVITGVTLS